MTYALRMIGRWRRRTSIVTLIGLVFTCYLFARFASHGADDDLNGYLRNIKTQRVHPIDHLHQHWTAKHGGAVRRQSRTASEAASEYTRRYQRRPPRQFDTWFQYAISKNYTLVDEFDTLEDTLRPYRAIDPSILRRRLQSIKDDSRLAHLTVQSRNVHQSGRVHPRVDWIAGLVADYIAFGLEFEGLELVLNLNDEPMVMDLEEQNAYGAVDHVSLHDYSKQSMWLERSGVCRLRTSRNTRSILRGSQPREWSQPVTFLNGSPSAQQNLCETPSLAHHHALFITPMSLLVTSVLVPIFSQARPGGFKDLLFPSPAYFLEEMHNEYDLKTDDRGQNPEESDSKSAGSAADEHTGWRGLLDQLYWAGGSTGGWNTVYNWKAMHRTRIAALPIGSTRVGISAQDDEALKPLNTEEEHNFPTPEPERQQHGPQNVSTIDTESRIPEGGQVPNRDDFSAMTTIPKTRTVSFRSLARLFAFSVTEPRQCTQLACTFIRLKFQSVWSVIIPSLRDVKHEWATSDRFKYVLDLDGNSFSGRFRRLLLSPSAVVKATIFQEWHEDLLVPWVHYFPLSMEAAELGEMARFLLLDERGQQVGDNVATASTTHVKRALRRADAEVWFLRCLIEYHDILGA